jgi:hypothetical protein
MTEFSLPVVREGELYSLKWHTFHTHLSQGLRSLFLDLLAGDVGDVTLSVEGRQLQAHKWLLSLCSPYFYRLFRVRKECIGKEGRSILFYTSEYFNCRLRTIGMLPTTIRSSSSTIMSSLLIWRTSFTSCTMGR